MGTTSERFLCQARMQAMAPEQGAKSEGRK
jgi:hypothetical protein